MAPNVCFIPLILFKLLYFADADLKDKSHNFGDGDAEQYFALLKAEYNALANDYKSLGEEIKSLGIEMEQKIKSDLADFQHDVRADMKPIFYYRDSAWKMMKEINESGTNVQVQINAIVTFLTEVISQEIQNSTEIASAEMAGKPQYVCMARGEASGLRSMKHVSTEVTTHSDSLDLRVTYVFEHLHVHYGLFFVQIWRLPPMRGALDIDFGKNKIELVLNLPKVSTLIGKLFRKECIVRLKDLNVKKLEYRKIHLSNEHSEGYDMLSSLVDSFLKMNQSMLVTKFEAKALEEIRRALRTAGNFVCNDSAFADLILRKGGSLTDDSESEAFKHHCSSGEEQKRDY